MLGNPCDAFRKRTPEEIQRLKEFLYQQRRKEKIGEMTVTEIDQLRAELKATIDRVRELELQVARLDKPRGGL